MTGTREVTGAAAASSGGPRAHRPQPADAGDAVAAWPLLGADPGRLRPPGRAPANATGSTPGASRAARILACAPTADAHEDGAEGGAAGVTLAELRAAYEASTGERAPASFGAEVSSLARRGHLRQVGGRAGRTRYARAESLTPAGGGGRVDVRRHAHADADARGAPTADPGASGEMRRGTTAGAVPNVARGLAPDDLARAVLAAVALAQTRAGDRDVTAAAVVDTLLDRRTGIGTAWPGSAKESGRAALTARVRSVLHTLARERRRGPAATRAALVVCAPDPHTGRPRWRLAATTAPVTPPAAAPAAAAAPAHATRTAAAAAAFAEAGRALGRPPSVRETTWYLDASGPQAAPLRAQDVAAACRTVLRRVRVAEGHGMARACFAADRFVVVASAGLDRTSAAPPGAERGAPADDPPIDPLGGRTQQRMHAVVHALDAAIERLAVADERAGADRLAARSARWRSPALGAFLDARDAACAAALRAGVGPALAALAGADPERRAAVLAEAIAASAGACDVLDAWLDAARAGGRSADVVAARRRAVAAHRAHLRACGALVVRLTAPAATHAEDSRRTSSSEPRAGDAVATTANLAPYAGAAARLAGVREASGPRMYGRARRVGDRARDRVAPRPAGAGHSEGRTLAAPRDGAAEGAAADHPAPCARPLLGPAPPARVDRVDGLALLVGATTARRARALVREAVGLLGATVRDPKPVRALLAALPPGDAPTRHAATVALGMLGHAPTWADATGSTTVIGGVDDPAGAAGGRGGTGTSSDAIAFALAVALADPSVPVAQAALLAARGRAPVHVRGVLDTARARIGAGMWLTAVE